MYLSELREILDKGEKPDLSRAELLSIFRKEKPLIGKDRLELFERLGLRDYHLTQEEVADLVGVTRSLVAQYDTNRL